MTEVLGFDPDADGEHEFLLVEKRGANTVWVAEQLARFADLKLRDVAYSGLKDRHALARQWFSLHRPGAPVCDWAAFHADGVRILQATRNRRKLRRGTHRSNRFRILLRQASGQSPDLAARLETIRTQGVPNYFGEQRFGLNLSNLRNVERLMSGARLSRGRRALALSAARAWLFNHVLERRVIDGTWQRLLPGDCANLDGSGSVFGVTGADTALVARASQLDVHPTGPLWGCGDSLAKAGVASLEREIADNLAGFARGLEDQRVDASRRALRLRVENFAWESSSAGLELRFTLVRGAFATAVLREVATYDDATRKNRAVDTP